MNLQTDQVKDNPIKVVVRRFGRRGGFGHEVFHPLRPWQMGSDGDKYPKEGYCSLVLWGSVIAALKGAVGACSVHEDAFIEFDKSARAQLTHELSAEFFNH